MAANSPAIPGETDRKDAVDATSTSLAGDHAWHGRRVRGQPFRHMREALRPIAHVQTLTVSGPPLSQVWADPTSVSSGDSAAPAAESDPETQLVYFDAIPFGGAVHADAVDEPLPVPLQSTAAPATLRQPPTAQPIDVETAAAERQLDELIRRELECCPEPQQRVWREVLQGLPAKEAEEILQIWKLTGRPIPAVGESPWPGSSSVAPANSPLAGASESATALDSLAHAAIQHNLRYAQTPGYRRRETVPAARMPTVSPRSPCAADRLDSRAGGASPRTRCIWPSTARDSSACVVATKPPIRGMASLTSIRSSSWFSSAPMSSGRSIRRFNFRHRLCGSGSSLTGP